jgi:hypothetical protein
LEPASVYHLHPLAPQCTNNRKETCTSLHLKIEDLWR